jgi:hypothetical protein
MISQAFGQGERSVVIETSRSEACDPRAIARSEAVEAAVAASCESTTTRHDRNERSVGSIKSL